MTPRRLVGRWHENQSQSQTIRSNPSASSKPPTKRPAITQRKGQIVGANRQPPESQHSGTFLHIRGRSDLLTERDISFCETYRKPHKRRGLHASPRSIERMQNKICCL